MSDYKVGDEVLILVDMPEHAHRGDVAVILSVTLDYEYPLEVRNVGGPSGSFGVDFDEVIKKPL